MFLKCVWFFLGFGCGIGFVEIHEPKELLPNCTSGLLAFRMIRVPGTVLRNTSTGWKAVTVGVSLDY